MAFWWVISLLWNWGIYLSRPTICKPYANPLFWCIVQNMHHSPDGLLMMGFVQVSSFGTITINPWTGIDPDKASLFGEFLTGFQLLVIWCYMYIIYTRYIALHAFMIFMTSNRDFPFLQMSFWRFSDIVFTQTTQLTPAEAPPAPPANLLTTSC